MFSNENLKNSLAIMSKCKIHVNFCLRANWKGTLLNRELISGHFFRHLMWPHDLLVMKFWLHVILTCIRDSAMSQSYAHFWSLYSWDQSSHHRLDPVSISLLQAVFLLRSWSHRQYRDCAQSTGCAECVPMFLGYYVLAYAQGMFPWLGSLALPQV